MNPEQASSDVEALQHSTQTDFLQRRDRTMPSGYAPAGVPGELLKPEESGALRSEWDAIQAMFVDDPKSAVARADELVKRVISEVEVSITRERHTLEQQWAEGSDVSTEDLRLCLQRYRGFFQRLLDFS